RFRNVPGSSTAAQGGCINCCGSKRVLSELKRWHRQKTARKHVNRSHPKHAWPTFEAFCLDVIDTPKSWLAIVAMEVTKTNCAGKFSMGLARSSPSAYNCCHLYTIDAMPSTFGLPFEPRPASVRDADTLNHERRTAVRRCGLGHNNCELGEHKAGEHL